jgi:hypothetical protein
MINNKIQKNTRDNERITRFKRGIMLKNVKAYFLERVERERL